MRRAIKKVAEKSLVALAYVIATLFVLVGAFLVALVPAVIVVALASLLTAVAAHGALYFAHAVYPQVPVLSFVQTLYLAAALVLARMAWTASKPNLHEAAAKAERKKTANGRRGIE